MMHLDDTQEQWLREYLWMNHGCPWDILYGDDGERQCSNLHRGAGMIDFKRDSFEDIMRKITAYKLAMIGSLPGTYI